MQWKLQAIYIVKEDISMPCPEKFRESLAKFGVDHTLVSEINEGHEGLVSNSPKKQKAEYFSRAIQLLDEHLDFESKYEILDYNACCKGGARDKAAKAFAKEYKDLDLSQKIKKVCQVPNMGNPVLNEDDTITTGIHWFFDGKFKCACPNFNKLKDIPNVSSTYCLCCAGHFRYHYQNMLGVKLKTKEIVSSPLNSDGNNPCVFVFECE
jgi:hypothetical protein